MTEPNSRPVPFRGGGFKYRPVRGLAIVLFLVLIGIWEIGSRTGLISNIALPAPSEVLAALADLAQTGMLWKHWGTSLVRLMSGWTMGTLTGIGLGLLIALWSWPRAGLYPLVSALFPIPKIALLPLFVVWFGIGEGSKVATIAFGTFFPTVIATVSGVDAVDRNLNRMAQSFNVPYVRIIRDVILPGALPAILAGFRISAAIAMVLLVAAEMIGAEYGVGAYILLAGSLFAIDQLMAGVVILSCTGLIVAAILNFAERRLLAWRNS